MKKMKKEQGSCKIQPAEFYDIAAQQGFYGLAISGLAGKHDNVRKYWEDIAIKLTVRESIEKLLEKKNKIRIVDLGCGSGEGYELLTHIPVSKHLDSEKGKGKGFALSPDQISTYIGIDVSGSMVEQGRKIYEGKDNVKFEQVDLNKGFHLIDEQPFDIYFSSYSSLSHLESKKLEILVEEMLNHAEIGSVIVFDLMGKYSIEWPKYWNDNRKMLPYNMAYLISNKEREKEIHWYDICYWTPSELYKMLDRAMQKTNKKVRIAKCVDRSIFVGRHMETGLFGAPKMGYRYDVNHLFDPDHRAEIGNLYIDLNWCVEFGVSQPYVWERLLDYQTKWNCVIRLVNALLHGDDVLISKLIETTSSDISNELKFLTWLYRNAYRFPATDFWASVMGPQIAMVLRNIEMSLQPALGCGHGLLYVVEIADN